MFIRDYLTLKKGTISNIEDLYFDFKSYDMKSHIDRQVLLEDMLKFAKYYRQILKGETSHARLNRKLKQIATIESLVHLPYLLSFFDYASTNNLNETERYEVLDTIENYWARRIICNYPANALQKMFATLHNDILKIYKRHKERDAELLLPYSQILKFILLRKQGTVSFPNDNDVKSAFPTRQIYRIPSNYKFFLFERMENENSPEANDTIVKKMKDGIFTIEQFHVTFAFFGNTWHDRYSKHIFRFHTDGFCKIALHNRTEHLLW